MADSKKSVDDIFELDRIRRLIDLMKEHGLTEVDLQQGDQQIRLARGGETSVAGAAFPAMVPAVPQPVAPAATPAAAADSAPADDENIVTINAPMVGTFYSRPNPNSDAYVKVGDHVSNDTTVCIIEAMKVFNEIPAEVSGRVVAILVDDDEPLEFGKPLFKIDTSN